MKRIMPLSWVCAGYGCLMGIFSLNSPVWADPASPVYPQEQVEQEVEDEQDPPVQEMEETSDQIGSGEENKTRSVYDSLLNAAANTTYPKGSLDDAGQLNAQKWLEASSDYDFTEHPPKREKISQQGKPGKGFNWSFLRWPYWPVVFKYGSFGLVALLLAYLILLLIRDAFKQEETTKESLISWETDPEKISFSRLEEWLRESLSKQDYAQGVRVLFLITLKELSSRSIIKWKRNKTNRDYLLEIQDEKLLPPYRYLSVAFDAALYGHYPVTETAFQKCREKFDQFSFQQEGQNPT
jgi:hypothetical protein